MEVHELLWDPEQRARRLIDLTGLDLSYLDDGEQIPGLDMGRRYEHAPIVEAILEFHVQTPEDLNSDALSSLELAEGYEVARPFYAFQGEFQVSDDGMVAADARNDQIGFRFHRADGSRAVLAGADRFAFIWTNDYTEWTDFLREAEAAWLTYKDVARPVSVSTVGLRYVNHIPMPARPIEISDYLRATIDIPSYLPQGVSSLFFQVDIPLPRLHANATITSAILPAGSVAAANGALLLDIDVKTDASVDTSDPEFDGSLRGTLDRLRVAKNYVFEACITDATRELIS